MIFHISNHSGVPAYLQLVQQVKQDIRLGLLKEGDRLPAVREVVTMIAINPNTVVKAYRELENQGFIEKRSGIGTFVSRQPAGPSPDTQAALLDKLDGWIAEAMTAGLDEESTEALFNMALHKRREEQHDTDSTN
jgi:GntR family transcriptional regulator